MKRKGAEEGGSHLGLRGSPILRLRKGKCKDNRSEGGKGAECGGRWHFNARAIVTAMAMRGKPEAGRLFSRREKLPNGGASVFWMPMAPAWEPLSLGDFPILRLGFNVLCSRVETTSGLFPTWKIEKVSPTVCVFVFLEEPLKIPRD